MGNDVTNRLLEKIRECADLPSLPAVALRVMDLTQKNDVTAQQVADAISMDPALVAKVLRTVNSPFYGCSQAISSMNGAVVLLGMQSVKTLVLGFSIVSSLDWVPALGLELSFRLDAMALAMAMLVSVVGLLVVEIGRAHV